MRSKIAQLGLVGLMLALGPMAVNATVIANVTVEGTHTTFLAGVPTGSYSLGDFGIFDQDMIDDLNDADTRPLAIDVSGYSLLSITADGFWSHTPVPDSGPDGKGISDPTRPIYETFGIARLDNSNLNLLVGVFTDDTAFDSRGPAPSRLDQNTDDMSMPGLFQTFAIGSSALAIYVPTGATTLYLGLNNGYEWENNTGSVNAVVRAVPEPGTLALFSLGLLGLGFARRRRT